MVNTVKFSEFADGGDLENDNTTVGLESSANAKFNNPWVFLPPGTTVERPAIAAAMYYRLRFNTTLESYEYYDSVAVDWIQLEASTVAVPSGAGVAGSILRSDGTEWAVSTVTYADSYTAGALLYASTTDNVAELTPSNSASLRTNAAGVASWSASMTDGQIMIGDSGGTPEPATLNVTGGLSLTNAANSITINGIGGGYGWTEVTATSQSMASNNGYILNNVALITATLPLTSAIGDTLILQGKGAGLYKIAQNAGQTINFGSSPTTTGVGGSLTATNAFDSIELVCITATSEWAVLSGPQGTFTVV